MEVNLPVADHYKLALNKTNQAPYIVLCAGAAHITTVQYSWPSGVWSGEVLYDYDLDFATTGTPYWDGTNFIIPCVRGYYRTPDGNNPEFVATAVEITQTDINDFNKAQPDTTTHTGSTTWTLGLIFPQGGLIGDGTLVEPGGKIWPANTVIPAGWEFPAGTVQTGTLYVWGPSGRTTITLSAGNPLTGAGISTNYNIPFPYWDANGDPLLPQGG
jgi:hypothetical protein